MDGAWCHPARPIVRAPVRVASRTPSVQGVAKRLSPAHIMREMDPDRLGADAHPGSSSVADVFAEPDGIVILRFRHGARLNEAVTEQVVRAHVAAAGGKKRLTLVDVRGIAENDRGSRQLAAGPRVAAVTLRLAILVGNPVSRALGNFFLRVSAPPYPTRIFSDEAAARRWLQESSE
jgi:hypothetical protein